MAIEDVFQGGIDNRNFSLILPDPSALMMRFGEQQSTQPFFRHCRFNRFIGACILHRTIGFFPVVYYTYLCLGA